MTAAADRALEAAAGAAAPWPRRELLWRLQQRRELQRTARWPQRACELRRELLTRRRAEEAAGATDEAAGSERRKLFENRSGGSCCTLWALWRPVRPRQEAFDRERAKKARNRDDYEGKAGG